MMSQGAQDAGTSETGPRFNKFVPYQLQNESALTTFPLPPSNPKSTTSTVAPSSWMCLICRDLLCRPVRPPCGHHACQNCLRDYSDKGDKRLQCPNCAIGFSYRLYKDVLDKALWRKIQDAFPQESRRREINPEDDCSHVFECSEGASQAPTSGEAPHFAGTLLEYTLQDRLALDDNDKSLALAKQLAEATDSHPVAASACSETQEASPKRLQADEHEPECQVTSAAKSCDADACSQQNTPHSPTDDWELARKLQEQENKLWQEYRESERLSQEYIDRLLAEEQTAHQEPPMERRCTRSQQRHRRGSQSPDTGHATATAHPSSSAEPAGRDRVASQRAARQSGTPTTKQGSRRAAGRRSATKGKKRKSTDHGNTDRGDTHAPKEKSHRTSLSAQSVYDSTEQPRATAAASVGEQPRATAAATVGEQPFGDSGQPSFGLQFSSDAEVQSMDPQRCSW
eukprot:m.607121 g.607121  ORF g.607121 m.607121 type:complete len:456 (+) comp22477_c0_seq2:396-1763(+)